MVIATDYFPAQAMLGFGHCKSWIFYHGSTLVFTDISPCSFYWLGYLCHYRSRRLRKRVRWLLKTPSSSLHIPLVRIPIGINFSITAGMQPTLRLMFRAYLIQSITENGTQSYLKTVITVWKLISPTMTPYTGARRTAWKNTTPLTLIIPSIMLMGCPPALSASTLSATNGLCWGNITSNQEISDMWASPTWTMSGSTPLRSPSAPCASPSPDLPDPMYTCPWWIIPTRLTNHPQMPG